MQKFPGIKTEGNFVKSRNVCVFVCCGWIVWISMTTFNILFINKCNPVFLIWKLSASPSYGNMGRPDENVIKIRNIKMIYGILCCYCCCCLLHYRNQRQMFMINYEYKSFWKRERERAKTFQQQHAYVMSLTAQIYTCEWERRGEGW